MNKIELLAPAGSMEALKSAVINGADAVYCGGINFGARANANNFDYESMQQAIRFCHLRNVKIYVTMNTLLFEDEFDRAMNDVDFYYNNGVDAIIVQDLGLLDRIRKQYPDMEIHASTQMHIHNEAGVNWLKKMGVKRVVLARETPINLIKKCCDLGVDIEIFTYGALCICYSGQCYMSHFTQNRSGNRGSCAQSCRMKYKLEKNGEEIKLKDEYLLSPKDLNVIENIGEIIEAGVTSLKIEGRMKRPEYVGMVTKVFKEAIDAYYSGKKYTLTQKKLEELMVLFNRGYTKGFIFSDDNNLMSTRRPNHMGIEIGEVIFKKGNMTQIKLNSDIAQGDGLRIISDNGDVGIVANLIEINGLLKSKGNAGDIISFYNIDRVNISDKVIKTTDINLINEINSRKDLFKRDIEIKYKVEIDKKIKVVAIEKSGIEVIIYSDAIALTAKTCPIDRVRFEEQMLKFGESIYQVCKISGAFQDFFMPVKLINDLKRKIILALDKKILERDINENYPLVYKGLKNKLDEYSLNCLIIKNEDQIKLIDNNKYIVFSENKDLYNIDNIYPITPLINEESVYYKKQYVLCNELGSLTSISENTIAIASSNFNVTNSFALQCLYENNIKIAMLSNELNNDQKTMLINEFKKRNDFFPSLIDSVVSKRCMMSMKHCVINSIYLKNKENCNLCRVNEFILKDGLGNAFLLEGDYNCNLKVKDVKTTFNFDYFGNSKIVEVFTDDEKIMNLITEK
ncbi:MAG: peptidase U32 family protein [Anaerorhabdus sp.]